MMNYASLPMAWKTVVATLFFLTMIAGIRLAKKFGVRIEDVFGTSIKKHLSLGTLKDEGDRYVLAPKAYYISNSVLCDFV